MWKLKPRGNIERRTTKWLTVSFLPVFFFTWLFPVRVIQFKFIFGMVGFFMECRVQLIDEV